MIFPERPTLKRKSSSKKILISSPSNQLLHFLTLPNPSASEDPRERLHIMTPKSQAKSIRHCSSQSKKNEKQMKKPSALSRVTFIRKKASTKNWAKNSMEMKQNKLTISTNYKSNFNENDSSRACRLNITFGESEFPKYLQV